MGLKRPGFSRFLPVSASDGKGVFNGPAARHMIVTIAR
jgi:hypothetical protein